MGNVNDSYSKFIGLKDYNDRLIVRNARMFDNVNCISCGDLDISGNIKCTICNSSMCSSCDKKYSNLKLIKKCSTYKRCLRCTIYKDDFINSNNLIHDECHYKIAICQDLISYDDYRNNNITYLMKYKNIYYSRSRELVRLLLYLNLFSETYHLPIELIFYLSDTLNYIIHKTYYDRFCKNGSMYYNFSPMEALLNPKFDDYQIFKLTNIDQINNDTRTLYNYNYAAPNVHININNATTNNYHITTNTTNNSITVNINYTNN